MRHCFDACACPSLDSFFCDVNCDFDPMGGGGGYMEILDVALLCWGKGGGDGLQLFHSFKIRGVFTRGGR